MAHVFTRVMDKTPREVWLQRIEAWKSSGMTARAFAEAHGFDFKTFENRKYHYGLQARRKPEPAWRDETPGSGISRGGSRGRTDVLHRAGDVEGGRRILRAAPSERSDGEGPSSLRHQCTATASLH